jgi:hypothetical protein
MFTVHETDLELPAHTPIHPAYTRIHNIENLQEESIYSRTSKEAAVIDYPTSIAMKLLKHAKCLLFIELI